MSNIIQNQVFVTWKKCICFSRAFTNSHNPVWGLASRGSSLGYPCCDRHGTEILFRHAGAVWDLLLLSSTSLHRVHFGANSQGYLYPSDSRMKGWACWRGGELRCSLPPSPCQRSPSHSGNYSIISLEDKALLIKDWNSAGHLPGFVCK